MIVGVPKETFVGERRVALVPSAIPNIIKGGNEVRVEAGAGLGSSYSDQAYADKGAQLVHSRQDLFAGCDAILQVRSFGTNLEAGRADLPLMRPGQLVIGMFDPLAQPNAVKELAGTGALGFALELMPRITRAQSMDILSSMATIAGYKAVTMAADRLPKIFPMLMTAAGTVSPARVLVIGVGVAGLQAIATARRLGAVVYAYDVRPAVKEQVQSLGAKFLELALETSGAEDAGGYAKAQDDAFYQRQRELMTKAIAESDVVITTAAVPGKKAPILITREMVEAMQPGSLIVDVAAERGGNCELTRPGETVINHGVEILGPANLPAAIPHHASQMYARNITTFLLHLVRKGQLELNMEDEIVRDTLLSNEGQVVNPRVAEALGGNN